ncbi:hypothetical protein BJY04DRAFT_214411 [Aspergillus karnatakaensis]|uniref:uncharacterized protein n=1 Tax=Aspergillus karnatakaensis TaxID=1810916 RepID=UPI003CCCC8D8
MEAIGAASAILAVAAAGVQCSVKLVTFAGQIKTAAEQITIVAEEVSLNASILQQLGELVKGNGDGTKPSHGLNDGDSKPAGDTKTTGSAKQGVFNETGLKTVMDLVRKCEEIFDSLSRSLRKASKELLHTDSTAATSSSKVKLSRAEVLKWPFLVPEIDMMRSELRNVKGTLMLMLQVAMLAYSRRMLEQYGEDIQRSTKIVAYSREDQELLVRSIVAAQKAQDDTEAQKTAQRTRIYPSPAATRVYTPSPSHVLTIQRFSPKAVVANRQFKIVYDSCTLNLPDSMVQSKLQECKESSNTTVFDQLDALELDESEVLESWFAEKGWDILHGWRLEWIQLGDYHTLIQGVEHIKARTLTLILSGVPRWASRSEKSSEQAQNKATWIKVHRKHLLPDTLIAYQLPWDWDETDGNYIIIKTWIPEDLQEELFDHTRQLREGKLKAQSPSALIELKVNDRKKDLMHLRRSFGFTSRFVSKIRQSMGVKEEHKIYKQEKKEEKKQEEESDEGEYTEAFVMTDEAHDMIDALLAKYTM